MDNTKAAKVTNRELTSFQLMGEVESSKALQSPIADRNRRRFMGTAIGAAAAIGAVGKANAGTSSPSPAAREPIVWPARRQPAEAPLLVGHTDTVPDIVGKIGATPSLVIFSEGNHLMALLGDEILGGLKNWAKGRTEYAKLNLDNVIVVTLPQPIVVDMILQGSITFGNLTLDVSRQSGFYPDVVMAGLAPLRELRSRGSNLIAPRARIFSQSRGLAMLVRKGNPLGIQDIKGTIQKKAKMAMADNTVEAKARARNRTVLEKIVGKEETDRLFANEVETFPGRLGIAHRDLPYMVAEGYADVAITQFHLVTYFQRTFPSQFDVVPIAGAERFGSNIAFVRTANPLRADAARAFEEYFFEMARQVYPRYGFAPMEGPAYGDSVSL
ncbi:substrate-binding domain-containing protein [Cupriavidus oxalaticus]|uniref:Uncharacterized protein n=1 Tax=Cupriavidus oxalaticus TaxID=96344 RepID=A0A5P3VQW7_9BURK|nr:substrate-binding domain-containing protein [Cupriavidus oxalaticus]QEZ48784.1 hypothetical protein D2917_31390 [Cupriavidus oxalaticus]